MALPCALGVPPLVVGLRWYLARAKDGYLREGASYSAINATLTETVEGARTVEALGLGAERIDAIDADIADLLPAERYTLCLRTVFFPSMELSTWSRPSRRCCSAAGSTPGGRSRSVT